MWKAIFTPRYLGAAAKVVKTEKPFSNRIELYYFKSVTIHTESASFKLVCEICITANDI